MMKFILPDDIFPNSDREIEEFKEGNWDCVKTTETSKDGLRKIVTTVMEKVPTFEDRIKALDELIFNYEEREEYIKASNLLKDRKKLIKEKEDEETKAIESYE